MEQKEEKKEQRRGGFGDRRPQHRPPEKKDREEEVWIPITKLGRLVKGGHIKSIEEVYRLALPIKGTPLYSFENIINRAPDCGFIVCWRSGRSKEEQIG